MTFPVNKTLTGIENLYALIQYTWPDHADVLNEDNVTLTRGAVTDPVTGTTSLTISASSPLVTGNKEVTYTLVNLENLSAGELVALDDVAAVQLVSTIVNNNIPCLPSEIVVGDLINTEGGWTVSLSAAEGALTVTGFTELSIAEEPVVGSEYVTIKFHTAGDVTSYRKMTALGLDDLPLEAVVTPIMEGINSYKLTVGVDDIVKFKFDPITGLPPEMEGMLSELNSVSHGGLDITVMELPSIQDAPSLSQANNVIVEAALPSVMTNLSGMFSGTAGTISGISGWDVSKVTDMSRMFYGCRAFNQDLSTWDVSNVTNMAYMFYGASVFNSDLSTWDVSNVTDMAYMFSGTTSFNSDLSTWDVSNVTNMTYMFYGASVFNGDLSTWDVSSVTNMSLMFNSASVFNGDLSTWDVSNVTDMSRMFNGTSAFNSDLSTWDVSNVTDMSRMFNGASAFNSDISQWDVSNVTNMAYMFNGASVFNRDLSSWCVSKITTRPTSFDNNANKWTLPKPVWGTCPVRG